MCFEQFPASILLCCTAVFSTLQINTLKQVPANAFSTATFKIVQNIFHLLSFCVIFPFSGKSGRNSSVGMATCYGLDGSGIESR
jgi:hypothetical protein